MDLRKIHRTLVSGRFTVIVSILFIFAMRLFTEPSWNNYAFWIVFVIQVGIALGLLQMNHAFTIIHTKTMLPAVFYLLLTGIMPTFYSDWIGTVEALGVLVCLLFLFRSYQNPVSQKNALNVSLVLTCCSLLWDSSLLLFPLVWFGLYKCRCFNYRTFFATIIGMLIVYMFVFAWSLYNNSLGVFLNFLPDKDEFLVIHPLSFTVSEIVMLGYIIILLFFAGFNLYLSDFSEKVRTSSFLHYLFVFSVVVSIALIAQSQWKVNWMLILFVPVSLILSHYFTLSTRKITTWLLLFSILFFIGIYVSQFAG